MVRIGGKRKVRQIQVYTKSRAGSQSPANLEVPSNTPPRRARKGGRPGAEFKKGISLRALCFLCARPGLLCASPSRR